MDKDASNTSGSTPLQEQQTNPVPSWAQDATSKRGSGSAKEKLKPVTSEAVPQWVKDTLDDPTLKATVAAGKAQDAADSLTESEGRLAPTPAPQTATVHKTT